VIKTPEDCDGNTEEGPETSGGIGRVFKSPFGSDSGVCFWGEDFLGCRILLGLTFPNIVVGSTGIGTGVAVLDVSVELDKEDGTLMEDMERGSKGILTFPFGFAFPCAFAALNLAVYGVSVFSLDSLDEDGAGDDGRERDCDREREGESAGVEGVRERWRDECASDRRFSSVVTSLCTSSGWNCKKGHKMRWMVAPVSRQHLVLLHIGGSLWRDPTLLNEEEGGCNRAR